MTVSDFECSMLALFCWRKAREQGIDGMVAVANMVRNLANRRAISLCEAMTIHDEINFCTPSQDQSYPDVRDPLLTRFLRVLTDVYSGRADDITNGAVYSVDLTKEIDSRFRTEILDRPDVHPMCAIIGSHHFFK